MSYESDVQSYDDGKNDTRECEAMRKMFVGGLSRSTAEDKFYEHFSQYGDIVDKVIITDPHTKDSRGFGFVTYSSSQSVENAFKGRPHSLDAKPLDIKRAMPREYNTAGAHAKTKKLFIGGITPDLTPEELRSYIESRHQTGKLEKIDFVKDKTTGKNKGFGFLDCSDNDFADRLAISENSFTLKMKTMSIKKAEPKEDDFNPRGDRGGRGGRGRGRGGDRGGRGAPRGRGGGYDGGYGGGRGGGGGGYDSYSTSYPSTRGGGAGGYSSGGYNQGQSGGNDGYGQTSGGYSSGGGDYSSSGGGGYSAGGGGYSAGGGGYSAGSGGYSAGGGGGGYSSGGGGTGGSAGGGGGYSSGGGGGGYSSGGGAAYSSGGGYASGAYSQGTEGGYSQSGGYSSGGRGGGRGGASSRGGRGSGGGQRYQPY